MPEDRNRRAKYLGFVAHEIKNPLSTALWSADLLRRLDSGERAGPRADKMVDASLRALRRMRRLVEDYFTIERLSERVLDIRREVTALRPLVESAIALLGEKEKAAAAGWALDVPHELRAECDSELIKRALRALFEQVARSGEGPLALVGQAQDGEATLWIGRHKAPLKPIIPARPEDQPGGDPDGSVLGFELARTVVEVHGGKLEERDGGLWLSLPKAAA
jgi:K+-sensing histidine kinase KdpD